MLQSFRDNLKGFTAIILVGIIIIPFAFWGVESLFVSGSSTEVAAEVNGEKISEWDVVRNTELQRQRLLSQFQDMPPLELTDEQLREPVLNQLIRSTLLKQFAVEKGMGVSDRTFNELVANTEAFQVEGRFDSTQYEYLIGQQGFTSSSYRRQVKDDLLINQLTAGLQVTGLVTQGQLNRFNQLVLQQRSWQYAQLPLSSFADDVGVSEAEVAAFYQEHTDDFELPDQVIEEYIELTPEAVAPQVEIDDESIRAQFAIEAEKAAAAGTSWHLAHILISPTEDDAHLARLQSIEKQLQSGADFGALVREFSEDFGSAENGGDIGVFSADAVPPGFSPAVEDLKEGEISSVVESDSGFHLIKVISRTDGKQLDFDENRERIAAELRLVKAEEKLGEMLEKLKDLSYNAESLAEVGEAMGLPVQASEAFSIEGGRGIAQYPQVIEAAFGEDVREHGYASDVLEVGDKHYIVIKQKEFIPSHIAELGVVRDEIASKLAGEKATRLLNEKSRVILARVKSGESLEAIAADENLVTATVEGATRFDQRAESGLMEKIFSHPSHIQLPVFGQAATSSGIAIYQLTSITPGNLDNLAPEEQRQLAVSLNQLWSVREFQAFTQALEGSAEITRGGAQ